MKKLIAGLSVFAFVGMTTGCSTERQTRTTTRTVETVPAAPVVIEKRTTTMETRTSD
ncbi:MAG: hypothetical protein ABR587_02280 [Candidatus Binatia bacterium]